MTSDTSSEFASPFLRPRGEALPGQAWFSQAKFGLFVHWDHVSQQGIEIGWPLVGRSIIPDSAGVEDSVSVEQYHSSAAGFDPTEWDPKRLAQMAKESGARYVVFTARHHSGYAMFHSKHAIAGVEHSRFGRDITRELVDAVRAEGLRVGLYYSLSDWGHPDYPAFTMEDRPYPAEHWPEAGWAKNAGTAIADDRHRRSGAVQWGRYLDYVRGQLTELLTDYGQIDLLWFDGEWERSPEEWDAAGLRELIKSLQPNVLINERLPGNGDYATPEQGFPVEPPIGPWELCMTIGEMWGWRPGDTRVKSARSLLTSLIEVASRGGNLLLNTAPRGDGSLNELHVAKFDELAEWMRAHSESVFDTVPTRGVDYYGPTTARPGTLYLHLVMRPVDTIVVRGIPVGRISRVRLLATGVDLAHSTSYEIREHESGKADPLGEVVIDAPKPSGSLIDVVAVDFA
jgi:alpha-L-fucosidase